MRTKTILLAAAVVAAGLAVSSAQTVYSVNAVGYVTVQLTNGYNLVSNPLNGTNNNINTTMPVAPEDSYILRWDPTANSGAGSFGDPAYYIGGSWSPDLSIQPGEGFFVHCETIAAATKVPLTFVGEVPQGVALVNTNIANCALGYSLISSIVPQAIALDAPGVGFVAHEDDYVLSWNQGGQTYTDPIYYIGGAWTDVVIPPVGGAIFLHQEPYVGVRTWTRSFSVN